MSILFDPLQAAVRRALEFDPDTRERIRELDGRVVEVVFTGLEQTLCVAIDQGAVLFCRTAEREPDLRLTGTPIAFARYVMAPDRVEITESGIKIEGDIGLAQRFTGILRRLDIDWEEWASRYVGDVLAYRAGRFAEEFRGWARHGSRQFRQDVSEYLQEELRVLAPRERVTRLMNDVDTTRSDVERLEQRIRRLRRAP
ncbi:MAG: SCP2 sterol-binding domain-containing protein [Gammaproteobacteria bacterium]|nr:SCP2 sterol-binding domain-containing protein [Gammaproteobacteria bacterium]